MDNSQNKIGEEQTRGQRDGILREEVGQRDDMEGVVESSEEGDKGEGMTRELLERMPRGGIVRNGGWSGHVFCSRHTV